MIHRLIEIIPGVYRGSAPNMEDVIWLKKHLKIKRIVSFDKDSGNKIDQVCQLLHINHIKCYIDFSIKSLISVLQNNLYDLLAKEKPTFIHCAAGKDRTSLIASLFEIKYLGKNPTSALKESVNLGFGIGLDKDTLDLFTKLILNCKPVKNIFKDVNSADIVSNERDYNGDYRDHFLDEARISSFSPYLNEARQYPYDPVYLDTDNQSPTRENYEEYKHPIKQDISGEHLPLVGEYNNQILHGIGPVENAGGFIYD